MIWGHPKSMHAYRDWGAEQPGPAQTSVRPLVYTAPSEVSVITVQTSGSGRSGPSRSPTARPLPQVPHRRGWCCVGKDAHSPGVRVALELLFDVPEEVVLRQEEWGAQSQELPALQGTGSMGRGPCGWELLSPQHSPNQGSPKPVWLPAWPTWSGPVQSSHHKI